MSGLTYDQAIGQNYSNLNDVQNIWVRCGWFEDNVLSKFTSMTSKKKGS